MPKSPWYPGMMEVTQEDPVKIKNIQGDRLPVSRDMIEAMRPSSAGMGAVVPEPVQAPASPMGGKSEIGTSLAIGRPQEALKIPEISKPDVADALKKGTDFADYGSAGIMAGGGLLGSLGKTIAQAGIEEMKAKQDAISGLGKSQQEAMSKAGANKYGALAQLIAAYRGALK